MNPLFPKPKMIKSIFQLNIGLVLPISIVLAFVLIVFTILDIAYARRELVHLMEEEAKALITSISTAGVNAMNSFSVIEDLAAERLLDNARLIEQLDFTRPLNSRDLEQIAKNNDLFRVVIYDDSGNRLVASHTGLGWGNQKPFSMETLNSMKESDSDERVLGFRSNRFGTANRFAVIKKRRRGGFIFVNIDSQEMLDFRKTIGLGNLFQEIARNEGIRFLVLQDSSQIIIATQNVDSMSTFRDDGFLRQSFIAQETLTRFTTFANERIFEVVYPFDPSDRILLRIGLATTHISEAIRAAERRALLSSLMLFVFGTLLSSWMISNLNYRQLQRAYKRIETYTGSMLSNMSDAVLAVDHRGLITLINKAAEKLFAATQEKVVGQACAQQISPLCPYLESARQSGKGENYPEEHLALADGERIVAIKVNTLHDSDGVLDSVFAVVQDITEAKIAEENQKRYEQIGAMGQLASGVAHEIRNPLNAISIIAQRLYQEFRPQDGEKEYEDLSRTIVQETRRINDIIQQFLQFARPFPLSLQNTDLLQIIKETVTLLQQQAVSTAINVSLECQALLINGDADSLKQVFLNLGQNALQACNEGGHLLFKCSRVGASARIDVIDDGRGIPADEINKIFNLYYTTKEGGAGIGLSIVQKIISQHQGAISVSSREKQGTTFTILLPIKE
ncbi:MAG: PAS domain S-box protein [Calditrichaeota bacterium]|nr:MAG: PAS domain S-box protein [Calditrichota bacterium]